jgi:outer membrane protein assembly factor BamB
LLAAGSNLACVSRTGVAFVEFADLAGGTVTRLSATGGQGPFRTVGRAVVMDGSLCVPVDDGLVIVPPGANAPTRLHTMERSGNVVTPPGSSRAGELVGHALVADSQGVHTFLSWDRAKTTLEARVTRAPRDPVPLLTYLQLALRQGKSELAPDLTDRTLALIDADRQSATSEKARGDLFALLHRALAASQRALDPLSRAPDEENTTFEFPPVRDGTLLNALSDRLMRVAETPAQRAVALFDRAFLLEFQQRPGGAVEALQEVLADESLATLSMRELGLSDTRADALAGETATQKLGALLTVTGPEPYAPYEEEAMHAASLLPLTARYDDISNLARRYPASSSAPALWVRASDAAIKEGSPARAREVLARGVDSVLLLRRIGRDANAADVSRLAGGLLSNADKGADLEPSLLLLVALEREFPGSSATTPSGTTTLASAVQSLRSRLASREGRFSIGDATSGRVVALEGWQPLTPLSDGRAGDATSLAPMVSRAGDRVALFAPSLADGRLVMLWSRAVDILPTVVQLTPERTLLYHPKTSSPVLEGVSHDGTTLWKTPSLRDLFDQASGAPALGSAPERINTPLDGMVRRDDVLFALDGATLVVGERAGRVVALDTGTGKPVWGSAPPLTRLFDIDARAGRVLVVGAMEGAEEGEDPRPVVLTLDLSTGVMVWTAPGDTLDEHARWGLLLSDADAVLGTSHRVTRLNARTGEAVWSNTRGELRDTGGGWLVGSSLFVLDDNFELRRLALASGEGARDGLNDQGRLKLPFEVYTTNTTLTLSSEAGLIVFDEQGAVAGIDAVQTPGDLVPALLGAERMVTLQFLPREENAQRITMGVPARVLIFSHPDGRLLSERAINLVTRPDALRAVDGKLLIDQGVCTTVVDIPFAVP